MGPGDLAGLTPEMISAALTLGQQSEELGLKKEAASRKSITDISDMIYKSALADQARATAEKYRTPEVLDTPYPVEVPGVGQVTHREWKTLPSDDKAYALFVAQSKKLGDTDIMSKREYEMLKPTDRERFLRSALDDPKLMEAAKDVAKAGAMNLGEFVERKKATRDVDAKAEVISAKHLAKLEKAVKEDTALDRYGIGTPEYDRAVKLKVLQELDSSIRNAYKNSTITRKIDGWYADGKLIRRNPYAR